MCKQQISSKFLEMGARVEESETMNAQELAQAAQSAIENWDADLMVDGQMDVLESIVSNPANFADNDGNVSVPQGWDVWKFLEEISSSLA